jgi:hypothetical protein
MDSANIFVEETSTIDGHRHRKPEITPLPKIQLAVLLALFLAEPITSTVIYPFINQGSDIHPTTRDRRFAVVY